MSTAEPLAIYDGRISIGLVRPAGEGFEAITAEGENLGRYNSAQAAANSLWEHAHRHLCGLDGGAP